MLTGPIPEESSPAPASRPAVLHGLTQQDEVVGLGQPGEAAVLVEDVVELGGFAEHHPRHASHQARTSSPLLLWQRNRLVAIERHRSANLARLPRQFSGEKREGGVRGIHAKLDLARSVAGRRMRGAVEVVGVTAVAMLSRLARPAAVLCRGLATSAQVRASEMRGGSEALGACWEPAFRQGEAA